MELVQTLLDGNGSIKATDGVMKASAGVTCASATAITTDEVIDLYHSVTAHTESMVLGYE